MQFIIFQTDKSYSYTVIIYINMMYYLRKVNKIMIFLVDYQEVGKANILLQAVDAVNSLMQGQSEFIEICKQEIIDLEKETNRYAW